MNILITGGASGLGNAITGLLAGAGEHQVYFTYHHSVNQARLMEETYKNTTGIKCDFKNPGDLDLLTARIGELKIDVLINNAYTGTPVKTYFHKMTPDDFLSEFMDNSIPAIRITQACIAGFRKQKSGKIITVLTSYLLNLPPVGSSAYVANKAFMASLVKSWATENIKFNISSNSVSPSFMLTNLAAEVDERVIEQLTESHPLKKLLTVEEVAEAVAFLVNSTAQINGMDLVINAGTNVR